MDTPAPETTAQLSAVTAVTVLLLGVAFTGPLLDVVSLGTSSTETRLGEGTATVDSASLSGPVTLSDGRFGTDVQYVRFPSVAVTVDRIEGRSRLVYRVVVPDLGVETSTTEPLSPGAAGVHRLTIRDRAVPADTAGGPYEGRVTVKVQSFAGETRVLDRNVTVGGGR